MCVRLQGLPDVLTEPFQPKSAAKFRGTDWGLRLPCRVRGQAIAQWMRSALSKTLSIPAIKQLEVIP